jgi:hypothetical protein
MVASGVPIELTKHIRDLLGVRIFIETGTGLGRTAALVSPLFETVYTIEAHKARFADAAVRFDGTNVIALPGESPAALKFVLDALESENPEPYIIFLDAHCFYRPQLEGVHPCPLLEEIALIHPRHVIIVDDEEAFTSVPHPKHLRSAYPEMVEVINALDANRKNFIFIEGKTIISVPKEIQPQVEEFIYKENYE